MTPIQIETVSNQHQLKEFVKLPWRVYKSDPCWVPPLISDMIEYLDPATGPFYEHGQVALFLARNQGKVAGTIAAFFNQRHLSSPDQQEGGFGFFEVVEDYEVAGSLLDTACEWLRDQGMRSLKGPTNFSNNERPGVLVEGVKCPPVMLEAHTPPYYQSFLERYGMKKYNDLYAWRAFRSQVGDELENIQPDLLKVAEAGRKAANVTIRKLRMEDWDEEIKTARFLFNTTLEHLPDHMPITEAEFHRHAEQFRLFLDPDLALFAEIEGKPVGFCVAFPDINQALIHLNGRLFPFGWLKLKYYIPRIEVVTFKLMGILREYRRRGLDALLYLEAVKAFYEKGYEWLDGSVTSEMNPAINMIAQRMGAERYKTYRIYQMML
jgi:GNAT superfamily N-acetyltransferase